MLTLTKVSQKCPILEIFFKLVQETFTGEISMPQQRQNVKPSQKQKKVIVRAFSSYF